MKLKTINVINPSHNLEVYDAVMDCVANGLEFTQAREIVADMGYFLPAAQYNLFNQMFDMQYSIDMGDFDNQR